MKFLSVKKKKKKKKDINIILAYSAIKIKANSTAPNSTLNPDTNSDSPSAKSNGVRLVSAKQEINHIPTKGKKIISLTQTLFSEKSPSKENVFLKDKKNKNNKANLTS